MSDLKKTLNTMKQRYREIFKKSADAIAERVNEIKPKDFTGDIFDKYEENSLGEQWQKSSLDMLVNDISHEIFQKWTEIIDYRNNFKCNGCAVCCNLACSEYSYDELKKRAKNGDDFAQQFTSIFIPYNSKDEAQKVYPEYIKMLDDMLENNVYFYHCPKLTKDKKCCDYENRPKICRVFPDNPLDILPESCGFYKWRQEVEPVAMMLHAMVEIIDFYKSKLEGVLK